MGKKFSPPFGDTAGWMRHVFKNWIRYPKKPVISKRACNRW